MSDPVSESAADDDGSEAVRRTARMFDCGAVFVTPMEGGTVAISPYNPTTGTLYDGLSLITSHDAVMAAKVQAYQDAPPTADRSTPS